MKRSAVMTWMGVCTALGWIIQTAALAFTFLSLSTIFFSYLVVFLNFVCKTTTGIVQISTACKDKPSEKMKSWNHHTYWISNTIENILILLWILDYARYCDWGQCGNGTSDFGGDLFFYYAIGFGLPLKVGLNFFFSWNMKKYYKETVEDDYTRIN